MSCGKHFWHVRRLRGMRTTLPHFKQGRVEYSTGGLRDASLPSTNHSLPMDCFCQTPTAATTFPRIPPHRGAALRGSIKASEPPTRSVPAHRVPPIP